MKPQIQFKAKKLLHPLSNHELNRSAEIQIQGKFEEKKGWILIVPMEKRGSDCKTGQL